MERKATANKDNSIDESIYLSKSTYNMHIVTPSNTDLNNTKEYSTTKDTSTNTNIAIRSHYKYRITDITLNLHNHQKLITIKTEPNEDILSM